MTADENFQAHRHIPTQTVLPVVCRHLFHLRIHLDDAVPLEMG